MISVETEDDHPIVLIAGRLDGTTVAAAETVVMTALGDGRGAVLDLGGLTYVASVGLRLMLLAAKRAKQTGQSLALCGLQPQVREVFEIGGFDTLLTLRDTRRDALAVLRG
ncbi:STAS domain-containing protein [Methylobacterium aquaticum]|uniref:STAS domain-containing protein n=1 Tax=Methylobacterium aquaticum TaxID=270351 RepID=UPI003D1705E7